jgi:tetratricopeptide (TPR) repeat protein
MDCRRPLLLALLMGAGGCHTVTVPSGNTTQPYEASGSNYGAQTNAAPSDPSHGPAPKAHRPETWVAYGDYAAYESSFPDCPTAKQQELHEKARKAYQEALKLDANCLAAHKALAHLYMTMNDHEHAVGSYQQALNLAPNDGALWFELGMCFARSKAWENAVVDLTKAVELDPENRRYHNVLGYTLARAGRYQEGLMELGKYNGEATAHFLLARMLDHLNQPEMCKAQLKMALEKKPDLEDARKMLARLNGAPAEERGPKQAAGGQALQQASYQEITAADLTPAPVAPSAPAPEQKSVAAATPTTGDKPALVLPPPPSFPIRYSEEAPTTKPAAK